MLYLIIYVLLYAVPAALFALIDILAAKKGNNIGAIMIIPILLAVFPAYGKYLAGYLAVEDFLSIAGVVLVTVMTSKKTRQLLNGETEKPATQGEIEDEPANCEEIEDSITHFKEMYQDMPDKKLRKILDSPDYLDVTKKAVQQILDERAGIVCHDAEEIQEEKPNVELPQEPEQIADVAENNYVIRFCRKCGSKLPEGSMFCNRCGTKVWVEE